MEADHPQLDQLQSAFKAAVEDWIAAIRTEEALASVNHRVAEIDQWEMAHFREEDARNEAKAGKRNYEAALPLKFFGFVSR
jgi:hypothetical protein